MQSEIQQPTPDPLWEQMSPLLDEALVQLGETDRQAILLRFVENKSLAEVGRCLGAGEDTARKRVTRALEKLRGFFLKRGVVSTAAIIAGAISANSVQAAPALLTKSITAVAMTKGVAASGSTLTLIKGALKLMAWTKAKTAVVVGVVALLATGTATVMVRPHEQAKTQPAKAQMAITQIEFPKADWAFSGYANPQSAILSFLWAMREGDGKTVIASITPALLQKVQKGREQQMRIQGKSLPDIFAQKGPKEMASVTGIRVLSQNAVSDAEIVVEVLSLGEEKQRTLTVKKIAGEWKIDDQTEGK